MSKITAIIPPQSFEIIRDRIAEILIDEIDGQAVLNYSAYLESVKVFVEETIIDAVTTPTINVSVAAGTYSNKTQGSASGLYIYHIDVYTSAKSTNDAPGRKISALRLHKLLGLVRYILEDPIYKTLGIVPGTIERTMSSEINIRQAQAQDAHNIVMGRLTFQVQARESNALLSANLISGFETKIKLNETQKGYFWEGE